MTDRQSVRQRRLQRTDRHTSRHPDIQTSLAAGVYREYARLDLLYLSGNVERGSPSPTAAPARLGTQRFSKNRDPPPAGKRVCPSPTLLLSCAGHLLYVSTSKWQPPCVLVKQVPGAYKQGRATAHLSWLALRPHQEPQITFQSQKR